MRMMSITLIKMDRVVLFNMQGMRNQYSKCDVVRNQRRHIRNTFILASSFSKRYKFDDQY